MKKLMTANKIIIITTAVISVISLVFACLCNYVCCMRECFVSSLMMGIFTGAVLSMLTATIMHFKDNNKIYDDFISTVFELSLLEEIACFVKRADVNIENYNPSLFAYTEYDVRNAISIELDKIMSLFEPLYKYEPYGKKTKEFINTVKVDVDRIEKELRNLLQYLFTGGVNSKTLQLGVENINKREENLKKYIENFIKPEGFNIENKTYENYAEWYEQHSLQEQNELGGEN